MNSKQIEKQIVYAYPTSHYAKKFGFYDDGCYVVETTNHIAPPKGLKGFKTLEAAISFAETINLPYSWYSLYFS